MSAELSGDRAIEQLREDYPAIYNAVYAMIAKVVAQGLAEADDCGDELAGMLIDLKRYEGHMLDGARYGGPTGYHNQHAIDPAIGVLYGAGPALDATVALVIDAPKLLAEVVRLRADLAEVVAALKVAVNEADAWHDDAHGGPIPDDQMNGTNFGEVRAVLAKHGGE